jgi:hypothetical protein
MEAFDMELLIRLVKAYNKGSKGDKTDLINEYCRLSKVKRKTAIKRFERYRVQGNSNERQDRRGRKKRYKTIHKEIIKLCWELAGYTCGENIHPMLSIYIKQLKTNSMLLGYKGSDIEIVNNISLGSLKRVIRTFPKSYKKRYKGNCDIYKHIPVMANFGKYANNGSGYVEVDFVEHNGGNSSGPYAVSACYVDIYSQWIARASGFGKDLESIKEMDNIAQNKIYHRIIHYHPDNDRSILSYLFNKLKGNNDIKPYLLSRSRPYEKNDNAHVEQKNGDKIRKLVGYLRYDSEFDVALLNEIYHYSDLYDNFFIASTKLIKKIYNDNGKVIKKIYDIPKTPYQRLIESDIDKDVKERLNEIYRGLNMVELRNKIDEKVSELYNDVATRNEEKSKEFPRHLIFI